MKMGTTTMRYGIDKDLRIGSTTAYQDKREIERYRAFQRDWTSLNEHATCDSWREGYSVIYILCTFLVA